jgi:hypothetical protein
MPPRRDALIVILPIPLPQFARASRSQAAKFLAKHPRPGPDSASTTRLSRDITGLPVPMAPAVTSTAGRRGPAFVSAFLGAEKTMPSRASSLVSAGTSHKTCRLSGGGHGEGGAWAPSAASPGPRCVFLFTGEGAHATQTDIASLRASQSWEAVESALRALLAEDLPCDFGGVGQTDLEGFLRANVGKHAAPISPLITTIINILNADRWRAMGREPSFVVGHSIGEVAAAYTAGFLPSIEDALRTVHGLGKVGAAHDGAMVHTHMTRKEVDEWVGDDLGLHIAAVNGAAAGGSVGGSSSEQLLSVTLCGPKERVNAWLAANPKRGGSRLMPPHPWHHPMYEALFRDGTQQDLAGYYSRLLEGLPAGISTADDETWVSATRAAPMRGPTTGRMHPVTADYWRKCMHPLLLPIHSAGDQTRGGAPSHTHASSRHAREPLLGGGTHLMCLLHTPTR